MGLEFRLGGRAGSLKKAVAMSIPKILHFSWKTEDVPGRMGEYLAMWRQTHADWDIRLWTDASMRVFVQEHYPELLGIYDGYPRPIQRADSFRYLVLNKLGGVYADLDVEPFRSINELVEGLNCFVGIEPDEHMGPDRHHSGTPFLLSNAFMGAVPNHPYFQEIIGLLPQVAHCPVFLSTGPSLTTGAGVRLPREQRPALVPPCLWSPHCDGGKPCTSDDKLAAMLGDAFDFVWKDRQAYVSHHWLTSWVAWHKQHKWMAKPFHALHNLKWWFRALRRPDLANLPIRDALEPYLDQTPKPMTKLPPVAVCVFVDEGESISDSLVSALKSLDYPAELLSFHVASFNDAPSDAAKALSAQTISVDLPDADAYAYENKKLIRTARLRNAFIGAVGKSVDWLLFVDGGLEHVPAEALTSLLETGYPVAAATTIDADGIETDPSIYRYTNGGGIRVSWKIRGKDGLADAKTGHRQYLTGLKAFRLIPLDGVGQGLVLVRRDVLAAGARFAEAPYHLHLGGEAFAMMAREKGFEVAGLTEIAVRRRNYTPS